MMDSALHISQQCHALNELQVKFASRMPLDEPARQVYSDVFDDHVTKLKSALTMQAGILKSLHQESPAPLPHNLAAGTASLSDMSGAASRSLELSRELVAGQGSNQREAVLILKDLAGQNSALAADIEGLPASKQ
jgi:hypothetical protein